MGTWSSSIPWCNTCAMVEYGKRIVEKKAKLPSMKDYLACLEKYTPGAKWNGRQYLDLATGTRNKKYIMVYQDTYIFGKGYMHTTDVKIPKKYESLKGSTGK